MSKVDLKFEGESRVRVPLPTRPDPALVRYVERGGPPLPLAMAFVFGCIAVGFAIGLALGSLA